MAERVLIHDAGDSGSALALLRQRLKENRIISITVGGEAKRFVPVDFLNFELRLGTGPLHLAVNSSVKCNAAIEADIDVLAKLCEEGLERGSELEAFAGREVEGHGDFLDVVVVGGAAPTTPSDRTEPLDGNRRPRKPSFRWTGGPSCTNNQIGNPLYFAADMAQKAGPRSNQFGWYNS